MCLEFNMLGFERDVTVAVANEGMTGRQKLGLAEPHTLMEMHQQPRNSAGLLCTAVGGGGSVDLSRQPLQGTSLGLPSSERNKL